MGFDRLREAGFTEEDIRNIRMQFHHLHGTTFDGGKATWVYNGLERRGESSAHRMNARQ